jgi:hypothetical protein
MELEAGVGTFGEDAVEPASETLDHRHGATPPAAHAGAAAAELHR